jgi:hypothetical protein
MPAASRDLIPHSGETIDISNLPPGVCIVALDTYRQKFIKRYIKSHNYLIINTLKL